MPYQRRRAADPAAMLAVAIACSTLIPIPIVAGWVLFVAVVQAAAKSACAP